VFTFRPGTADSRIYGAVNGGNEYRLPEAFAPADIIIDIGAHIGSFSFACLMRGAGRVVAFEAEAENFRLAQQHLREYGERVEVHNLAVWRSDRPDTAVFHSGYTGTDGCNTGGGDVLFQSESTTPRASTQTISLDAILSRFAHVRLLKLDCEGSEWPILLTSRMLDWVDAVCGEYHALGTDKVMPKQAQVAGYDLLTRRTLDSYLRQQFPLVATDESAPDLGHFWAARAPLFSLSGEEQAMLRALHKLAPARRDATRSGDKPHRR